MASREAFGAGGKLCKGNREHDTSSRAVQVASYCIISPCVSARALAGTTSGFCSCLAASKQDHFKTVCWSTCRKAAQLYKEAGRRSAAAEALSKAAKLVEEKNPQVSSGTTLLVFL
jgi:hypothetical protein